MTRRLPWMLVLALMACGDDDDGPAPDAGTPDAVAIDAARADARIADAAVDAKPCDMVACQAIGSDHRCDRLGNCTNRCVDDTQCHRGFNCENELCRCNELTCRGIGDGRRCVENHVGPVNVAGPAVTLCTYDCDVGWPLCPGGYMCQSMQCLPMP